MLIAILILLAQESQPTTQPTSRPRDGLCHEQRLQLDVLRAWGSAKRREEIKRLDRTIRDLEDELAAGPPKNRGKSFHPKWKEDLESRIGSAKASRKAATTKVYKLPEFTPKMLDDEGAFGVLTGFAAGVVWRNVTSTDLRIDINTTEYPERGRVIHHQCKIWISRWSGKPIPDDDKVDLNGLVVIRRDPKTYLGETTRHLEIVDRAVLAAYEATE